jgi:AcrR family transcriptional regulator
MAAESVEPGLRERKRARTRETIARCALELFDRQGFHQTTIPQIAEAADVSPRTVSAYFPHKEDMVFKDGDAQIEDLSARLRDREPGESAADALLAWFGGWMDELAGREEERRTLRRVIDADDGLRAYEHRFVLRAQEALAEAFARDLGVGVGELEPRMAAAATMTIFVLLGEDEDVHGDPTRAMAVIERALLFIGAGVRALRGSPGPGAFV